MNPFKNRDFAVTALAIESLPPEMQDELITEFGLFVTTEINLAILEKIPTEVQESFKMLIEEGKEDEAKALATAHIPDLETFLTEETKKALTKIQEMRTSLD